MVARVDFPTPVVPPSRTTSGRSSRSSRRQPWKRRAALSPSCARSTSRQSVSSPPTPISRSPRRASRRSTSRASSKARSGARPLADSDWAINPFEYGRPWPLWTTIVSGSASMSSGRPAVELDERIVHADRSVADQDDPGPLLLAAPGDRVARRGLQLGEVDVAALGDGAIEVGEESGAAREVRGADDGLDPQGRRRAGGEQRHAGGVGERLGGLGL